MNALKKLEDFKPNKPYHGFAKLSIGYHEIRSFRYVKNKFGKKGDGSNRTILVELNDEVVFLPQYFCQKLNDADLNELNSTIEKNQHVYLYFGGRAGETRWVIESYIVLLSYELISYKLKCFNHTIFYVSFFLWNSAWIIRIIGHEQKKREEFKFESSDEEIDDGFASQDRNRNMHLAYLAAGNESQSQEDSQALDDETVSTST